MCVYTNISLTEYTYICMYIQNAHVCMYMYKVGDYLLVCLHSAIFFIKWKANLYFFHVYPSEVKEDISFFVCFVWMCFPSSSPIISTIYYNTLTLRKIVKDAQRKHQEKSRTFCLFLYQVGVVVIVLLGDVTCQTPLHDCPSWHDLWKPI